MRRPRPAETVARENSRRPPEERRAWVPMCPTLRATLSASRAPSRAPLTRSLMSTASPGIAGGLLGDPDGARGERAHHGALSGIGGQVAHAVQPGELKVRRLGHQTA